VHITAEITPLSSGVLDHEMLISPFADTCCAGSWSVVMLTAKVVGTSLRLCQILL
jgi:hypothetical protein